MALVKKLNILLCFAVAMTFALPSKVKTDETAEDEPPLPKHAGVFDDEQNREEIAERLNDWKPENENNIWELSGLYQGDIMRPEQPDKNGLLDEDARWPDAIVPYSIDKKDFSEEQIEQIEAALASYHNLTCVRFRAYKKGDRDFVRVRGDKSGCWSYVGRHGEGQVINLQNPGCLRQGTIVHELMHALGFYHQQSAADRDSWVAIKWANILPGREHNFDKYDRNTVSDYGVAYDYGSVMHYSATAFSRNGRKTIVPKMENVTLGQRHGFSEKDIMKINLMYKSQCEAREKKEKEENEKDPSGGGGGVVDVISSLWPFTNIPWIQKE